MANTIFSRLRSAYNVFVQKETIETPVQNRGYVTTSLPHRHKMRWGNEKSISNAVLTRTAIDVSNIKFRHSRIDENEYFLETIDSGFNKCLSLSANIDQSSEAFFEDVVVSLFDEGVVGILPVDTSTSINDGTFDILSMRTAKILEWFPRDVRIEAYNDNTGQMQQLVIAKEKIAIVENPFYSVMNQHNSTLQRLIRKLNLLDVIDEQSGSGKLDIIIKLPYTVKGEARLKQAEERAANLESQLQDSKYGVAYVDGTEEIIQLNRAVENNLLQQVEYLTKMLYGQLGISENVLNGTANEEEMLNYYNRTIEPISSAIANEMKRKFLTPTAISQGQSISFFRDMFGVITAANLAELADKLTRNEIVTGNEFRGIVGMRPSKDPSANELRNKNLNKPTSLQESPIPVDLGASVNENVNKSNKGA